jgi:hypothetical protein
VGALSRFFKEHVLWTGTILYRTQAGTLRIFDMQEGRHTLRTILQEAGIHPEIYCGRQAHTQISCSRQAHLEIYWRWQAHTLIFCSKQAHSEIYCRRKAKTQIFCGGQAHSGNYSRTMAGTNSDHLQRAGTL